MPARSCEFSRSNLAAKTTRIPDRLGRPPAFPMPIHLISAWYAATGQGEGGRNRAVCFSKRRILTRPSGTLSRGRGGWVDPTPREWVGVTGRACREWAPAQYEGFRSRGSGVVVAGSMCRGIVVAARSRRWARASHDSGPNPAAAPRRSGWSSGSRSAGHWPPCRRESRRSGCARLPSPRSRRAGPGRRRARTSPGEGGRRRRSRKSVLDGDGATRGSASPGRARAMAHRAERGRRPRRSPGPATHGRAPRGGDGTPGSRPGGSRRGGGRGPSGRRRPAAAGDRGPSYSEDSSRSASRRGHPCRRSQSSRNMSRALARRQRTVASRRPMTAATSAEEKPSRSRSTKIVRYATGIRSRMNRTSCTTSA